MKTLFLLLFNLLLLISLDIAAQESSASDVDQSSDPCDKGDPGGEHGCTEDPCYITDPETGRRIRIAVIRSSDPNEIIGPPGYDTTVKWVSAKANLPYKILFENDPDFATAPAQKVIIYMPIHPNLNPNALRISDFGFGSFVFEVPPNTAAYTQRLDVRDSLGVFVDVTAGVDITNRRAFWIFESIDPATGLAGTLPADAGFLPVNDSTIHNGEGFVTLTIQAGSSTQTRDSIAARASIIFDINEPLATNVANNLIDALAPTSAVSSLPTLVDSTFTIHWTGQDDSLGAGLQYYDLYVSKNDGPFGLYRERMDSTYTTFTGERGARYGFYTLATDFTGNKEAPKTKADQTIIIPGTGVLVSVKAFLQGPYTAATGLMTDNLRVNALLPDTDPYPALGFLAVGNNLSNAKMIPGLEDSVENKAITDWVWLELRNRTNPAQVVATRPALMRKDGSVVNMDGFSPVYFDGTVEGNYYLAIRHRNHLGVMTASSIALNNTTPVTIDFTLPETPTFGTDAQFNQSGIMLMRAGNVNGDKNIRYNGGGNDKNAILLKIGLGTSNNVLMIYDRSDVNLDGRVRYNGASNDKNAILNVVGLPTPNKVFTEQIP